MYEKYGNYDKFPAVSVQGKAYAGYKQIGAELNAAIRGHGGKKTVVTVEAYIGTDTAALAAALQAELRPSLTVIADDCARTPQELDALLADWLTDDRVFGYMCPKPLSALFDNEKLDRAQKAVAQADGLVLVVGTGARLIAEGDVRVYAELSRWEIQLRYRKGLPNFNAANPDAPVLSKYKRGFFVEWRMCDRFKQNLWGSLDYVMETNKPNAPVMVRATDFYNGLATAARRPFRTVPYFDPGVWGGQWMKDVCGLDKNEKNFAWSFDGVPEENSLLLRFNDTIMELPAIDLVLYAPVALLGDRVHARFGAEFPIRFDFLDTVGGGNLSLQVHPLTEYIQQTFGMHYTQDESYYILDAKGEQTYVYLGLKKGVDPKQMEADLYAAQAGEKPFDAEKYVNKFRVKKHDHVLIPAGTVHCSGKDTMVLEISATPYIFTFKLWDWGRLGLDGLPRPTHIAHGMKNIQFYRDTDWVRENLLHQTETLASSSEGVVERTGLHKREFIETRRYTAKGTIAVDRMDSVNMCNLVEGESAIIESPEGKFAPFTVHYAETFIVPYDAGAFTVRPAKKGDLVAVIVAAVR